MDMLIRLYPLTEAAVAKGATAVVVRKPLGFEQQAIVAWVTAGFGSRWASEAGVALANRPVSLFGAFADRRLVGFACYDATARGMFGPIGVDPSHRASGIGAQLLCACLADMRAVGYAYAVAGSVGAPEFFARVAGATGVEGSTPGLYAGSLPP
jgi:GNAT superfamily N-acetyltransferase